MPPRRTARNRSKTPAGLWMARKDEFQRIHREGDEARQRYRDWLALRLGNIVPGMGTNRGDPYQLNIHVAFRIYAYYQAVCYDEAPENHQTREGAGDPKFAPTIEKLVTKMLDVADAPETWRTILADVMTDGAGVAWWGLPRFPNPVDVQMMNWGVSVALNAIDEGGYEPVPGMDHEYLAKGLLAAASDAERTTGMPFDRHAAILQHYAKHVAAAQVEARRPVDWTQEQGTFWVERSIVGEGTVWDTSIQDLRYASWMGHRILLPIEVVEKHESFSPAARKAVRPVVLEKDNHGEVSHETMTEEMILRENGVVPVWRFYDRRNETQHFIPEQSEDGGHPFYLEDDESYPFWDFTEDRPAVAGFFPCTVVAPYKCNLRSVERTFGIPILALAEPVIKEIIKLESEVLSQAKRNARQFGWVGKWTEADKRVVTSGMDGGSWDVPSELWDKTGETGVRVLELPRVSADLARDRERAWMLLARTVGVPYPALVGESVEDTLGQAKIAAQSGNMQTSDFRGQLQRGWAHMADGARAIAKIAYGEQDVKHMLGDEDAATFLAWKQSETRSDKMRARFDQGAENVQRTEQLMKALNLVISPQLIQMGVRLKPHPLIAEVWRSFKLGEPEYMELTPEELMEEIAARVASRVQDSSGKTNGQTGAGGPSSQVRSPRPAGPNEPAGAPDMTRQEAAVGRSPAMA